MNEKRATEWGEKLRALLGKKNAVMLLGIAGIALIGLSELWPDSAARAAQPQAQTGSVESREENLEARLAQLLREVDGAGEVRVMVTLEGTEETVYAQDETLEESLSQSGTGAESQLSRQSETQREHLFYDDGTADRPLVESTRQPAVQGVAVLCEGGASASVQLRITQLVSTVLGVPTSRVCVTPMQLKS